MKLLRYLTFPIIVLTLALMIRSSSYADVHYSGYNGNRFYEGTVFSDSVGAFLGSPSYDANLGVDYYSNPFYYCLSSTRPSYTFGNSTYYATTTYKSIRIDNVVYTLYFMPQISINNRITGFDIIPSAGHVYNDYDYIIQFLSSPRSSYDENIQLKAWQYVDYQLFSGALGCLTHWQVSLDMLNVVDHVDMTVTNNTTGVTTYVGSVPSWYNFNPGAYGSPGDNISVSATPYDSSGNWGTTKVFSMKIRTSIADAVTNWFNSGSSLVSTSNEFNVNVIGIKESNTYDTTIKPNANTPVPSTGTNVTTNYSPVITTNSNNTTVSDITNYIDESQTVTNNYNETVNNVYQTTTFNFDFDFDNAETSVTDGVNFLKGVPKAFNMVGQLFVYLFPFLDPKISFIICSAFGIVIAFGLVVLFVKFLGIIL